MDKMGKRGAEGEKGEKCAYWHGGKREVGIKKTPRTSGRGVEWGKKGLFCGGRRCGRCRCCLGCGGSFGGLGRRCIHRTGGGAFGEFGEEDGKRRNLVVGEGEVRVEGCFVGGEGERFGEKTDAKLFKCGVAEHAADICRQDGGAVGCFLCVGCDGFDVNFETFREIDAEGG